MAHTKGSRASGGSRISGDNPDWLCVARLGAPHGVRGDMKVEALTQDPQTLRGLKSFHKGADGELVSLRLVRPNKGGFIGHIEGIDCLLYTSPSPRDTA